MALKTLKLENMIFMISEGKRKLDIPNPVSEYRIYLASIAVSGVNEKSFQIGKVEF